MADHLGPPGGGSRPADRLPGTCPAPQALVVGLQVRVRPAGGAAFPFQVTRNGRQPS
jgi:hypothetical protein